jgi:hypothetical protein
MKYFKLAVSGAKIIIIHDTSSIKDFYENFGFINLKKNRILFLNFMNLLTEIANHSGYEENLYLENLHEEIINPNSDFFIGGKLIPK